MIRGKLSPIYRVIWLFAVFICLVSSLDVKNKDPHSSTSISKTLKSDSSHEEVHSQNGTNIYKPKGAIEVSNSSLDLTTHKSPRINTEKARPSNLTNHGKNVTIIPGEGGAIILPPDLTKLKTNPDNNDHKHKTVSHKIEPTLINQGNNTVSDNKTTAIPPHPKVTSTVPPNTNHSSIKTETSPSHLQTPATNATKKPRRKKPLYTIVPSESKESNSFIESSTTGRDYVLPIVLIILALPLIGFIIKLIYRRGTEFTERQQYHRMYLIDGMYNAR